MRFFISAAKRGGILKSLPFHVKSSLGVDEKLNLPAVRHYHVTKPTKNKYLKNNHYNHAKTNKLSLFSKIPCRYVTKITIESTQTYHIQAEDHHTTMTTSQTLYFDNPSIFNKTFHHTLESKPDVACNILITMATQSENFAFFEWAKNELAALSITHTDEAIHACYLILKNTRNSLSARATMSTLGKIVTIQPERLMIIYEKLKSIAPDEKDQFALWQPIEIFTFFHRPMTKYIFSTIVKYLKKDSRQFWVWQIRLLQYISDYGGCEYSDSLMNVIEKLIDETDNLFLKNAIIKSLTVLSRWHAEQCIHLLSKLLTCEQLEVKLNVYIAFAKIRREQIADIACDEKELSGILTKAIHQLVQLIEKDSLFIKEECIKTEFEELLALIVQLIKLTNPEIIRSVIKNELIMLNTLETSLIKFKLTAIKYILNGVRDEHTQMISLLIKEVSKKHPVVRKELRNFLDKTIPATTLFAPPLLSPEISAIPSLTSLVYS